MNMQQNERSLSSIIDKEAKEYAIYTVENRAIPNMMDGFKPVQRFIMYRALEMAKGNKDKFHKLASVAGGVADAGYHHGEVSAQEAGALMANTWNNNVPFLEGQGNFGSRLVQEAAASRYIYCRVSDNFRNIYKDLDVAPEHPDKEHLPPRFYLPIIPTVLLNGVKGIATGYATQILPHSLESVVTATKQAILGESIDEPQVSFPKFSGDVVKLEDGRYELHGKYVYTSKNTIHINEIPYQWDRAKYVEKVLDPLEDAGKITYDDDCSKNGFGFKVKLKKDFVLPVDKDDAHKLIMDEFKLVERISQYIVVIDNDGKLNDKFSSAGQLIQHFVKVRKSYIQKRIEYMIEKSDQAFRLALAKALFIKEVNSGTIVVKGKTKTQLKASLVEFGNIFTGFEDQVVSLSIYQMTDDEIDRLRENAKKAKVELDYWKSTDVATEYMKDLGELIN